LNNKELMLIAYKVKKHVIDAVHSAGSGHPGGSLSISETLALLYFEEMQNLDINNPKNPDRDRFVLSKGHCSPALYGVLAEKGFFCRDLVKGFRQIDSCMQGHPSIKDVPGVDMSTGSLGQGISAACGMAISAKLDNKSYRVYSVMGDGETQEGQVWEAAMFAAHYKLDNLCAVLDFNGLQIDGNITDVMSPLPLDEKFKAFNWNVIYAEAHDFDSLRSGFAKARECKGKPSIIIAKSTKGKGVSFMENAAGWHGNAPNDEQYAIASAELDAVITELGGVG